MSELDTSLQELRDDLRSSITRPDLGQVAGRARQRIVRRRMQIGAITAVVLVSVAVPVLRSLPSERTANPPPDPPVSYQLEFADATHGFALGSTCEKSNGPCTFTLLSTTDAGQSWQPRVVPAKAGLYTGGQVRAIDADHLVIQVYSTEPDAAPVRYVSADAGRTWREAKVDLGSPRTIAPGSALGTVCAGEGPNGCTQGVGTIDGGGDVFPVVGQPSLDEPQAGEAPTAGGRYWAAGRDRATGRWAISVTSDAGKTWTTTPVDLLGEPWRTSKPWSVVENDGVMYATVTGMIGVGPLKLLAIFRSTDKGVSWTPWWQATQENVLMAVDGSAVATDDGRLLVYSAIEGTLETRDGKTFTKAEYQLLGPVTWTRAGYLAAGQNNSYALSRDGNKWLGFTVR